MAKKTATKTAEKKEIKATTKKEVKTAPKKDVKAPAPKTIKLENKVVKARENKEDTKEYVVLEHDLLTQNYTKILQEKDYKLNAPHLFKVVAVEADKDGEHKGMHRIVGVVHFQEGPIKENGVNGVANEDLIGMVLRRLEGFQNSEYKCRENACAITKLEEALMWLRKRTNSRIKRNVEGTSKV